MSFTDRFWLWLSFKMPQRLIYWCSIRLMSRATVGEYGDTIVSELLAMDALKRWETTSGRPFSDKEFGNKQADKRNSGSVSPRIYVCVRQILSIRDGALRVWRATFSEISLPLK